MDRRKFLVNFGRAACTLAIGGVAYRIVGKHINPDTAGPVSRYVWAIDPEKCTGCGICESACVRTPSAVKAVNDQKKCSLCVVCYGHITNKNISSDKIMTEGIRVCKHDAVVRKSYSGDPDGYFTYNIDDNKCTGCGLCVKYCNEKGSRSMFLIIRPDLCLACNSCNIADKCPEKAIDRVYIGPEDDFKGEIGLESY
jgi:electron transport complex protein RnfB